MEEIGDRPEQQAEHITEFTRTYPGTYESIGVAEQDVRAQIAAAGWKNDGNFDMDMVIGMGFREAVANAVRYGCGNRRGEGGDGTEFSIALTILPDRLVLIVRDPGEGFVPDDVPDPVAPENLLNGAGRGIYLMQQVFDEVNFNERGNEVTLVKYRNGAEHA
jgi:anti-sigma regulatory factor (Ser/Thr protein kinase)